MQCWCSARFDLFPGAVPLAELISTQLLKGAEMPLEDLYAPRTQRLLEFSWNGEWSNWKESKWIQENWQTLHCFVVSCDKGVVVQSILIFDLQFMCSHVLFRTRWLVFSWFIVVQEGSSSHVLFFALPGLLLLTRIIVWTVDKWTSFQNATFLYFSSFTVGLWRILANYRLR